MLFYGGEDGFRAGEMDCSTLSKETAGRVSQENKEEVKRACRVPYIRRVRPFRKEERWLHYEYTNAMYT